MTRALVLRIVLVVGILVSRGQSVRAQAANSTTPTPPTHAPGHGSLIGAWCVADSARFCAGVEAGGGKLAKCLSGHEADLLPECKIALHRGGWRLTNTATTSPTSEVIAAPRRARPDDGRPAPRPVPPPPPAQPATPPALGAATRSMAALREVCGPEVEKFCAAVQPGRGRMARCLDAHRPELGSACHRRVAEMIARLAAAPRPTDRD